MMALRTELWIFEEGTFINEGDGGSYDNWAMDREAGLNAQEDDEKNGQFSQSLNLT